MMPQRPIAVHCASKTPVFARWAALLLAFAWVGLASCGSGPAPAAPAEQSVRPGINERYLDPNLDVERSIRQFEVESREIYTERLTITKELGLLPGMDVADIGAGTGLFLDLFGKPIGPEGTLYAVDIAPAFVTHLQQRAKDLGLSNVRAQLCAEDSVDLPADSIDLAFVCDTYHHFEYPQSTLASIRSALRSGGSLVVIDFIREPGVSREWVLNHVRAGEAIVRAEIESAGFELVRKVNIEGFRENYFLHYRKP